MFGSCVQQLLLLLLLMVQKLMVAAAAVAIIVVVVVAAVVVVVVIVHVVRVGVHCVPLMVVITAAAVDCDRGRFTVTAFRLRLPGWTKPTENEAEDSTNQNCL